MSLRINHNVSALNSWRNLTNTDTQMAKTLEKLSSGYKLNRASDNPAGLVISEQMRAQIGSMEQATGNSEAAISMIQTAEGALNEVSRILVGIRQLSVHAANEGVNDDKMLEADQAEIENALGTIDRIARQAQFGTRFLLDGSNGTSGTTIGKGIKFISSGVNATSSPADGYKLDITQIATRAKMEGARPMTEKEMLEGGIKFVISEGGRSVEYLTRPGENMESLRNQLHLLLKQGGIGVGVDLTSDDRLALIHKEYGSDPIFNVSVSSPGLLAEKADEVQEAQRGVDVAGTIGGELSHGSGQFLTAARGTKADGTVLQFTGEMAFPQSMEPLLDEDGNPLPEPPPKTEGPFTADQPEIEIREPRPEGLIEGYVQLNNNSLQFQVGPNQGQVSSISLPNTRTTELSKGVDSNSNFQNLAEIDVRTAQGAQDSIIMVDSAIDLIAATRGDLGAFQKNTLESNLNNLRYATENLVAAESIIRDTDMAKEMSEFTKNQILMTAGTAMLSQANQSPKSVLSLLNGGS